MAQNKRIYYAVHAVGIAPLGTPIGSSGYRAIKGVQNVGMDVSFQLEQIYQLGQLDIYENIEDIPEVSVTMSKVLDGRTLISHASSPSAVSAGLAGRYNDQKCMIAVSYYPTTQEFASGTPLSTVVMSGAYLSSLGYNLPLEGSMTEETTFVCNDRTWYLPSGSLFTSGTYFTGAESPLAGSGGVQRRENINMTLSRWPIDIPGISGLAGSGVNPTLGDGSLGAHIQNITINTSLARTELFEQGRRGPYHRYINFPTEVTCSIEVTADEFGDDVAAASETENLTNQRIYIVTTDNTVIDLGTKNKLSSVSTAGGETGGGNVTVTYNYSNFNVLKVTNPADPAGLT